MGQASIVADLEQFHFQFTISSYSRAAEQSKAEQSIPSRDQPIDFCLRDVAAPPNPIYE